MTNLFQKPPGRQRPYDYLGFAVGQLTKRNRQETVEVILAMYSGAVLELYVSKAGDPSYKLRLPSGERKDVASVVSGHLIGWGLLKRAADDAPPMPRDVVRGRTVLNDNGIAVAEAWNGKLPL